MRFGTASSGALELAGRKRLIYLTENSNLDRDLNF